MPFPASISLQLYSAREFPTWGDRLKELAGLGLKSVEPFGGLYQNADEFADQLVANGLTAPSGHFGIDMVRAVSPEFVAMLKRFGTKFVFIPHLVPDQRPKDRAGWAALGREVGDLAKRYRDLGFVLGWHNHDFEIVQLADGSRAMDTLLETAPELVWECDIAWVVKGNGDPVEWIARHKDRLAAFHVKDLGPEGGNADEAGWADVGHGRLDWSKIWPAARATKAEIFALEHDKPSDFSRFARRSLAAIDGFLKSEAK